MPPFHFPSQESILAAAGLRPLLVNKVRDFNLCQTSRHIMPAAVSGAPLLACAIVRQQLLMHNFKWIPNEMPTGFAAAGASLFYTQLCGDHFCKFCPSPCLRCLVRHLQPHSLKCGTRNNTPACRLHDSAATHVLQYLDGVACILAASLLQRSAVIA